MCMHVYISTPRPEVTGEDRFIWLLDSIPESIHEESKDSKSLQEAWRKAAHWFTPWLLPLAFSKLRATC